MEIARGRQLMTTPGCDYKRQSPGRCEVYKGKHLGDEGRQEGPVEPNKEHQNRHGDQVHASSKDPCHGSSQFCRCCDQLQAIHGHRHHPGDTYA